MKFTQRAGLIRVTNLQDIRKINEHVRRLFRATDNVEAGSDDVGSLASTSKVVDDCQVEESLR